MIVVRVCDAVVLSLSLTGLASYGLGIVALCVPGAAGVGEKLIEMGGKVMDARDAFADKAANGLNQLQKALPFLAAANAASVASLSLIHISRRCSWWTNAPLRCGLASTPSSSAPGAALPPALSFSLRIAA